MAEAASQVANPNVFISYSRDDLEFADQLQIALKAFGYDASIDRENISAAEAWERRLGNLIRAADTIVFVLSPSSAASKACGWEVEQATKLSKRIIPVACRPLGGAKPPPELAELNYIFFYPNRASPGSGFGKGLALLKDSLSTDLEWLREHTRLMQRASEWETGGRPANRLLSGADIGVAKAWAASRPTNSAAPTALHLDFIRASEDAEASRTNAERQRLDQMAAAQAEREQALERERTALHQAQVALRKTQRAQWGIGTLLICIIVGLVGWINQEFIKNQWNWYGVMRPYMLANFRPHVLATDAERALRSGRVFRECASNCPEMIVVPAGQFIMGAKYEGYPEEGPQTPITIAQPLAISIYTVTFQEWDACTSVGGCPQLSDNGFGRGRRPVINETWDDAKLYVEWLSRMTGKPYRLLSEAEWEYAARAGTISTYSWGSEIGVGNANCANCGSAWDNKQTAPVGSFKANPFGLYDMHGNVWQRVEDCHVDSLKGIPADGSFRTSGNCDRRVIRGGGWGEKAIELRVTMRSWSSRGSRVSDTGFRVARTLAAGKSQ